MLMFVVLFIFVCTAWILKKKVFFQYKPKNMLHLYEELFATRGVITNSQANTENALKDVSVASYKKNHTIKKFGVVLNLRLTKDGYFVCFTDKYLKRLTGVPGKLSSKTFAQIQKYKILGECQHYQTILTLQKALALLDDTMPIIFDISCSLPLAKVQELQQVLKDRVGIYAIVCGNYFTYQKFKKSKEFPVVLWKYNFFRKRLNVIREKEYKGVILPSYNEIVDQLRDYPELKEVKLPSAQDLIFSIVDSTDTVKSIVKSIWSISNKYTTRLKPDHNLLNMKIAHRGIFSTNYAENSIQAIEECIQNHVAIEADFFWYRYIKLSAVICYCKKLLQRKENYSFSGFIILFQQYLIGKGEVRVGHQGDKISEKLGQEKSLVDRIESENSITIDTFLSRVKGKVPVILDVKDFHFFSRSLIKHILLSLKDYQGEYAIQSFNPLLMRWLYHHNKEIIRGQVGHSLRGLYDKIPIWLFWAINFFLFYSGRPDYIVYDLDPNVHVLSRFNNILGLPVLGYAPKCYADILPFCDDFQNFICENLANKQDWSGYKE